MKANLLIMATAGFLAVSQTALFPRLSILGVRPDLLLLATISVCLIWGLGHGGLIALAGGLLLDIAGSGSVGLSSVALLPVALLASAEGMDIIESRLPSVVVLALLGTVVYYLVLMVANQAAGGQYPWVDVLSGVVLPSAIVNSVASLPIFGMFWLLSIRLKAGAGQALP